MWPGSIPGPGVMWVEFAVEWFSSLLQGSFSGLSGFNFLPRDVGRGGGGGAMGASPPPYAPERPAQSEREG